MIEHISVVIIVKNGERTIEKTLNSCRDFSEVVVYDNGSTDNTREIINKYANINLVEGSFIGFGPTKQKAATYAKNDWILNLDADEELDDNIINSINNLKLKEDNIYLTKRISFYNNKRIKYSGWGVEKIPRLYNRKITNYSDDLIHEKILIKDLDKIILDGFINHYSFLSISDFMQKMDKYSEEYAKQHKGKKKSSPIKAIIRAKFNFMRNYIFKLGFLDGYRGLLICASSAAGVFYKYLKLYELNKFSDKL